MAPKNNLFWKLIVCFRNQQKSKNLRWLAESITPRRPPLWQTRRMLVSNRRTSSPFSFFSFFLSFLFFFLFLMFLSFIPPLSLISGTQSLDVHKHTLANVGWWIRKHKTQHWTANRTFYCWRSEVKGINWVTLSLQPYLSVGRFCVLWPPFNLLLLLLSLYNTQSGKNHLHKMVRIIVIINLGKFSSSFSIGIFVKNTVQRLKIIT